MKRINKRTRFGFGLVILALPWIILAIPEISHYLDVMVFAGIYTLITLGLSMLMGYGGQISLGQAAFYGMGAYISAILTVRFQWDPWLCMLLAIAASALLALLVGMPSLKLRGHYLAMATLAFGIIMFTIFNEEADYTGGPDGLSGVSMLSIGEFTFDTEIKYYYLVWGLVFAAFLLSVNLIQSTVGRALRAIHESETAALAMGINVAKYKVQIFMFSAALASLGGSLFTHYINFVNPSSFDLFFSIKLITMIILGGFHSIWGAIIGAILVTFLSTEWLAAFEEYEVLVFGVILLVMVATLPDGLVSIPEKIQSFTKRKVWKRWF